MHLGLPNVTGGREINNASLEGVSKVRSDFLIRLNFTNY